MVMILDESNNQVMIPLSQLIAKQEVQPVVEAPKKVAKKKKVTKKASKKNGKEE